MEREVFVKNTIGRIEQLPTKRVQEVKGEVRMKKGSIILFFFIPD